MTSRASRTAEQVPWTFRLFAAVPLEPVWVGAGLALMMLAVYFGVELATGQVGRALAGNADAHVVPHFRTETITAFLIAYLATARIYLARWTRQHVEALRPLLRARDPQRSLPAEARGRTSLGSRIAGAAGIAAMLVVVYVVAAGGDPSLYRTGEYWGFEHVWIWIVAVPHGWLIGCFAYAVVLDALAISRLAAQLERVDLLDPSAFSPFVHQGLRSSLVLILYCSIGSLQGLNFAQFYNEVSLAFAIGTLAVATAGLVTPVLGVRRRIRHEKRALLAKLRAEIRRDEARLLRGKAASQPGRVADLVAHEGRIQAVREWPFDAPSLMRFSLYLGVGAGSWLGAALVERLLSAALD